MRPFVAGIEVVACAVVPFLDIRVERRGVAALGLRHFRQQWALMRWMGRVLDTRRQCLGSLVFACVAAWRLLEAQYR